MPRLNAGYTLPAQLPVDPVATLRVRLAAQAGLKVIIVPMLEYAMHAFLEYAVHAFIFFST